MSFRTAINACLDASISFLPARSWPSLLKHVHTKIASSRNISLQRPQKPCSHILALDHTHEQVSLLPSCPRIPFPIPMRYKDESTARLYCSRRQILLQNNGDLSLHPMLQKRTSLRSPLMANPLDIRSGAQPSYSQTLSCPATNQRLLETAQMLRCRYLSCYLEPVRVLALLAGLSLRQFFELLRAEILLKRPHV